MLIGKDSVLQYIDLTKCKAFRIYRGGAGGNRRTPVYYYEEAGGTEVCKTQFSQWADLNNYANPIEYSITIYPKGKPTGTARDLEGEEGGNARDSINSPFYLVAPNGMAIQPANNTMVPAMM